MPALFPSYDDLFHDEPTEIAPRPAGRKDARDAARAAALSPDRLRGGGRGCAAPALGCSRTEYTTDAAGGYLRRNYDTGRWWAPQD
jgi:hypothetical protein